VLIADELQRMIGSLSLQTKQGGSVEYSNVHVVSDVERMKQLTTYAPKFRLDYKAMNFITGLANNMTRKSYEAIRLPIGMLWLETPWMDNKDGSGRVRYAYLYMATGPASTVISETNGIIPEEMMKEVLEADEEERRGGSLVICAQSNKNPSDLVMTAAALAFYEERQDRSIIQVQKDTADDLIRSGWTEDEVVNFLEHHANIIAAFSAVMASPKVHAIEQVSNARLNKQRIKSRKHPLSDYSEVRINLDVPQPKTTRGVDQIASETVDTHGKKRRHFVMPFSRVKNGKIEMVKPHWRGDASLGVKPPRYALTKGK
jgi:hypothetical protein